MTTVQHAALKEGVCTYATAITADIAAAKGDIWQVLAPFKAGTGGKNTIYYVRPIPELHDNHNNSLTTASDIADARTTTFSEIEGATLTDSRTFALSIHQKGYRKSQSSYFALPHQTGNGSKKD